MENCISRIYKYFFIFAEVLRNDLFLSKGFGKCTLDKCTKITYAGVHFFDKVPRYKNVGFEDITNWVIVQGSINR